MSAVANLKIKGDDYISDQVTQLDETGYVHGTVGYIFLRTHGFHLSKYKGGRELEETLRLTSTRGDNLFAPFRKIPSVNSTTKRRTPPPGANRSTFGTKPLYNAATPSSRAMVNMAG